MFTSYFKRLKYRLRDTGTLTQLFKQAEVSAKRLGDDKPGAEHVMVAAMDLPDGTAAAAMASLGVDKDGMLAVLKEMKGLADDADIENEKAPSLKPFQGQPSLQKLMSILAKRGKQNKDMPLLGAHILQALAEQPQGPVGEIFDKLNLSQADLKQAVEKAIDQWKRSQ